MENAELFQQCLLSGGFEFRRWCARCRADAAQISGHAPGMAHALNCGGSGFSGHRVGVKRVIQTGVVDVEES
jgi:hypothetical protein